MRERVRNKALWEKIMTPEEAARLVAPGDCIGTSGFTVVGYPKSFPIALADYAEELGKPLNLTLITGASVGDELDGSLARAGAVSRRYPYQTNGAMRDAINRGEVEYVDIHLSRVPMWLKNGTFGRVSLAVIEAVAIDEAGNIIPTMAVGCSDALVQVAEKVIVEINTTVPVSIQGLHDIYTRKKPPFTEPIPIVSPGDRIGTPYIPCNPEKIAAIVFCDRPDGNAEMTAVTAEQRAIAGHLIRFLEREVKAGRLTDPLPPLQSGVGGVANAILSGLAESDFRDLTVYTEVMQDAVLDLILQGKVKMASATALTVSPSRREEVFSRLEELKERVILRPEEVSNSGEVINRLGVIAINTALEVDLSGNVNSTHVDGVRLMNGIGGSGDFGRNAGLTIFTTASTAKEGLLSCVVALVSHVDHTEHDVDVLITEQGLADLRGLSPYERAEKIIENCAHPRFQKRLRAYLQFATLHASFKHGLPRPELTEEEQRNIIREIRENAQDLHYAASLLKNRGKERNDG